MVDMVKRDHNTDDDGGYPVGGANRPSRDRSDGWWPTRESETSGGTMPPRGQPPASGTHERPSK